MAEGEAFAKPRPLTTSPPSVPACAVPPFTSSACHNHPLALKALKIWLAGGCGGEGAPDLSISLPHT